MEHLEYTFKSSGGICKIRKIFSIVGVVASGNLEVMMERKNLDGGSHFVIDTSAQGFDEAWKAVITDFIERNKPSDLLVSINDNAASPAVVSMRLDQAFEDLTTE
ncbi:MAG: malonate decarboxylase acyl carrier protein [Lentisphaerae bacterium GWF2_45_14]|nr:MAG: malonate decarboxylase acyl carrier protein [Lentisphaerae bacterium GWF2_45_14]